MGIDMVIGHQRILAYLEKNIANQKLAHAYLFWGPSSIGKKKVASEFIEMLLGEKMGVLHPDLMIVEPQVTEGKGVKKEAEITIEQTRKLRRQLSLSAQKSLYKIALIDQADRMTASAANALLKTLEEPQGNTVIILLAENPKKLLKTIVSRCRLIQFLPVPDQEIVKKLSKVSPTVLRLAGGRPGLAIQYSNNPKLLTEKQTAIVELEKLIQSDINSRFIYVEKLYTDIYKARAVLDAWLLYLRDIILVKTNNSDLAVFNKKNTTLQSYSLAKLTSIIKKISKTEQLLYNPSINTRLLLEVLMLDI